MCYRVAYCCCRCARVSRDTLGGRRHGQMAAQAPDASSLRLRSRSSTTKSGSVELQNFMDIYRWKLKEVGVGGGGGGVNND